MGARQKRKALRTKKKKRRTLRTKKKRKKQRKSPLSLPRRRLKRNLARMTQRAKVIDMMNFQSIDMAMLWMDRASLSFAQSKLS